jgi:hypothetical protein
MVPCWWTGQGTHTHTHARAHTQSMELKVPKKTLGVADFPWLFLTSPFLCVCHISPKQKSVLGTNRSALWMLVLSMTFLFSMTSSVILPLTGQEAHHTHRELLRYATGLGLALFPFNLSLEVRARMLNQTQASCPREILKERGPRSPSPPELLYGNEPPGSLRPRLPQGAATQD